MPRKTTTAYHTLAAQKGLLWLGPEVTNVFAKTWWQCSRGHQWQTTYNLVSQKGGCPICANNQRKPPAAYHAVAARRNFQWLGPEARNKRHKTGWTCAQGHQWQADWESVNSGYGCRVCKGTLPKVEADYTALAQQKGLRWLGPTPGNTKTPTHWGCANGHEWWATYDGIRVGKGCKFCRQEQRAAQPQSK